MTRLFNTHHRPVSSKHSGLSILLITVLCIFSAFTPGSPLLAQQKRTVDVIRIQPFRLEKPFQFDWRKERPQVSSGLLVVFKVDTSLVRPKNGLEPVLYAGNHTVQRINQGYESGFVIGIIPAQIDLSKEPVWFGAPALPERVDAKIIRAEKARAISSGVRPAKAEEVKDRTKELAAVPDLSTLLRKYAADLILEFSPREKRLAESWRLPETGK